MAAVYRVWDTHAETWRAAKVMLPAFARRKRLRARFEREAHTMARLHHPNLVRVVDVGTIGHGPVVPFMIMELLPGGTLLDWVRQHGKLPPRKAVAAVMQICEGVRVAHEAGVVHRDIKPHNVLVTADGQCKLADFGIARSHDGDLTRTGSTMGTLGYMPPEQRKDAKSVDVRADIYSLGATLWYLLADETVIDLFLCEDDPSRLEGIPRPLRSVIQSAVAYDRSGRQPDIDTLVGDLQYADAQLPPDPPSPGLQEALAPTPESTDAHFPELEGLLAEPTGPASHSSEGHWQSPESSPSRSLPYFMPGQASQQRHNISPMPTPLLGDDLPDYIDRQALSDEGRLHPLPDLPPVDDPTPDSELPPPPPPPLPTAVLGAAVLMGVVTTLIGVWLVMAAQGLSAARADALAAREGLYAELHGLGDVVEELTVRGVPRTDLEGPYFAYLDTEQEPQRAIAAEQVARTLQRAADDVERTDERVDRVAAARVRFQRAVEDWQGHTSGMPGGLLHTLGFGAAELPR